MLFGTLWDDLAGACTLKAANACLETQFLPEWNERLTVSAANTTDAHRTLSQRYQIARASARIAKKGEKVRVEARLDGSLAMRYDGAYLDISASISRQQEVKPAPTRQPVRKDHNRGGRSRWMRDYPLIAPKPIWQVIDESNRNS